jgi:hypothetical protein
MKSPCGMQGDSRFYERLEIDYATFRRRANIANAPTPRSTQVEGSGTAFEATTPEFNPTDNPPLNPPDVELPQSSQPVMPTAQLL